ncbi:MAG: hypothetical protein Q8P41_16645 [Pseudomonadota bacterium]|nr:hypothetical protein [Pseudomonadota bacterium]
MLLFVLSGCALLFGNDRVDTGACTEIGCADGISLDFRLTEPGDYTVTAVAGGETVACTASLPFDGTESCTGPGYVVISGTELPPADQMLDGMWLETVEATDVHLTIVRSGETVIDEVLAVEYAILEPNGPECGPTCEFAQVDVSL